MRSTLQQVALLTFLAPLGLGACGVGTSQSSGTHHVPVPPIEDAGTDAESDPDGGCVDSTDPVPACTDCEGRLIAPVCVAGGWQCPEFGCPAQCGGSEPISCPVSPGPCSPTWTVQCLDNTWTCVEQVPVCDQLDASDDAPYSPDADYPDASVDGGPDAPPPPPPFSCGNLGCDPTSSYCQITTGGPVNDDGGATSFYCISLPTSCVPGGAPSCACIQADQGIGCGCVEAGGEVTVTCEIP
jgi:hypothetical protein